MAASDPDGDVRDIRDELPAELIPDEFVGVYEFPDNSRRRIPGAIYLVLSVLCLIAWLLVDSPIVNDGFAWAALTLGAVGAMCFASGWRMTIDEKEALVSAQQALAFPVGHASAQQVWHGLRSRPTWRVLCYSVEDPPTRRALILIDAVDGHVVEQMVQDNLEQWG